MQTKKMNSKARVLLIAVCSVVLGLLCSNPTYSQETQLQVTDCVKCHQKQPAAINANGGKHKTAVTCLDCHLEHLPLGTDTIPQCSMCHSDAPHFDLENCLKCHTDPHMPIASLQLPEDAKTECGTCHDQVLKVLTENKSMHQEQSCVFCHDVHGKIPDCSQCHEPHMEGQQTADCLTCHTNPHNPLNIVPVDNTPVAYCGACHTEVAENLGKTTTKHGTLLCVYCHKGQHPTVPQCTDCHGKPHGPAIHEKYKNCVDCHMDPHNLVK